MRCLCCNSEMEQGYLYISAAGNIPCPIIEWSSAQKQEKRFFGTSPRTKKYIKDSNNGKFSNFFYCKKCEKIYGEFDV